MSKAAPRVKRPSPRRSVPDQERADVRRAVARAVKQEMQIRRLALKLQREVQRTNDALQRLAGEFVPRMFGETKAPPNWNSASQAKAATLARGLSAPTESASVSRG